MRGRELRENFTLGHERVRSARWVASRWFSSQKSPVSPPRLSLCFTQHSFFSVNFGFNIEYFNGINAQNFTDDSFYYTSIHRVRKKAATIF